MNEKRACAAAVRPFGTARRGASLAAGLLLCGLFCFPASAQQASPQNPPAALVEGPPPAELTLKDALDRALKSSRDLALARIKASVALRQANLTKARFSPNLFTGSGAVYTNGIPETPGGTAPSLFNMAYVQTLFNPPLRGQYREQSLQAQIEQLQTDITRDSVIVKTASTFLELNKVRHGLELLRKERDSTTRVLQITRDRVAEGQELPIEITRAELASARVVQRSLQMEGREDVLQADLRDLCSVAPDREIELVAVDKTPDFADAAERPLHELVAMGIANSVEIRQAELDLRSKQERLKGEKGGYFPTVDLVGKYSLLSRINNYDQYFRTFQKNNINVGLQISIPIFSARTSAAVDLASADLHRSELELAATRHRVENEVRTTARRMRETEATREVARLELQLAQQELQILQAKYEQGRANLRDVENQRLEENSMWLAFLDADFDNQQASLELLRMTGQLSTVLQ